MYLLFQMITYTTSIFLFLNHEDSSYTGKKFTGLYKLDIIFLDFNVNMWVDGRLAKCHL